MSIKISILGWTWIEFLSLPQVYHIYRPTMSSIFALMKKLLATCIVLLFMYQAYWSWIKYQRGDTIMITELHEPEWMSFPSVTLCRGINPFFFQGDIEKRVDFNMKLENWIYYTTYQGIYLLVAVCCCYLLLSKLSSNFKFLLHFYTKKLLW